MSKLDTALVNEIVEGCFSLYGKTPKSGKPIENEWTVLSCIVKYETAHQEIEVVSLGTGSKCIGVTKMSPRGDVMNDSHAEVFARRGFLLYLYENINNALKQEPSIFRINNERFELKKNIEFAFYSSQLPCGDASIVPMSEDEELFCEILQTNKHKLEDSGETEPKRAKLDVDVHRTGAKCLQNTEQDTKEPGAKYHTLGLVRTKPGRGDRTLSVSCSDKIARWTHLGIQGSLLSLLCQPIYIKHYIFGSGVPYSEETLQRAILNRNSNCTLKDDIKPYFYQSLQQFQSVKTDTSTRPAAGSIVWVKLNMQISEVAVQGKKLGVTKKKASSPTNSLCISKYNLYKRFLSILENSKEIKRKILDDVALDSVPYNKMKKKAKDYVKRWSEVKENFFKSWTVKPDMWDFCIHSS